MRLRITFAFMVLLLAFSCKKSANALDATTSSPLIGKWTEVSATNAPGGRPIFFTVNTPGPAYVTFGDTGEIQTDFFINSIKYNVSGSDIILTYSDPAISTVDYD